MTARRRSPPAPLPRRRPTSRRRCRPRRTPPARRADDDRPRRRRRAAAEDRRPSPAGRLVRPRDAGPPARRRTRTGADDLRRDEVDRRLPGEHRARPAGHPRPRHPQRSADRRCRPRSSTPARSPRERTAAISGVAIGRFAPRRRAAAPSAGGACSARASRARSHLPVLGPRPAGRRADACSTATRTARQPLAAMAAPIDGHRRGDRRPRPPATRSTGADVVVTAASFGQPIDARS